MSDRRTSAQDARMRDWIRQTDDRLNRLELGGAIAGPVSFGSLIEIGGDIGGVTITVVDTGGGGRNVVFTNQVTGASYTILL